MKHTLLVVSTNRDLDHRTQECLDALLHRGAGLITQRGTADVALARNIALTMACDTFRRFPHDVALMVDDDMVFTLDQVHEIVAHVRATRHAAAGMYATAGGTLAAKRLGNGRWLAGLGFLALHREALLDLEARSEPFTWRDRPCHQFTWTSIDDDGAWWSEDYRLCERLGGVDALPIAVGHLKRVPLYPDEETLRKIADGVSLGEGEGRSLSLVERVT